MKRLTQLKEVQMKKNKHQHKSDISKKDKIIAFVVIVLIFVIAAIAAVYYSLSKSGLTLF
ncbi:hypothetical protein [Lutibacter sp. B1]|uniref:hypothetical protein n=1 Tax=Lutibacter sp. B1 TaxID=2725996 RepID=UPI0014573EF1|nr:hypothetical protein [Lutibacter sp. B1]NLP58955.1 hypothetical protein [Lutibacter sp. B1]